MTDSPANRTEASWSTSGWVIPAICALHCMVAPVLAVFAPTLVLAPGIEPAMMTTAVVFAVPAMHRGTRRHRRPGPFVLAAAGLVAWLVGHTPWWPGAAWPLTAAGGLLLFAALWRNRTLSGRCGCTTCVPALTETPRALKFRTRDG